MHVIDRRRWCALLCAFMMAAAARTASAGTLTLAWDPSPDANVIGYLVYVGTQSGVYSNTFDVGSATVFAYTSALPDQRYYFSVAAYAPGPTIGPPSTEVNASIPGVATAAPTIAITLPTSNSSYSTDQSFVTLGGTAAGDAVTDVTWKTDRGSSGRATGTTNWIAGVPLQRGRNTITVQAVDAARKGSTRTIVVTKANSRVTAATFEIVARHSGKCLSIDGASLDDWGNAVQWTCVSQENQHWTVERAEDGSYFVIARQSGKCLSIDGASLDDGGNAVQWTCVAQANQQWTIKSAGNGAFYLVARHSRTCLSIDGASLDDWSNAVQWTCVGAANQQWSLRPVGSSGSTVRGLPPFE